jgi:hypothetical protein
MTTLMVLKPKVNLSYIMIIFARFDELILHHDVCSLSFSTMMCVHCHFQKYIRGSKRVLNTHGRNRGPKRLIGDQVQVFPTPSTRPSCHFWLKDGKKSRQTHFERWIRTATHHHLVTDATGAFKYFLQP